MLRAAKTTLNEMPAARTTRCDLMQWESSNVDSLLCRHRRVRGRHLSQLRGARAFAGDDGRLPCPWPMRVCQPDGSSDVWQMSRTKSRIVAPRGSTGALHLYPRSGLGCGRSNQMRGAL